MFISFVDCIQNIEKIEKELLKIGITDIQINQDGYINSLYWLKVKHPNANKGDAITFIKNHVACDYTVSFGNETNVIEMFLASDISICVVNAYNVIKDDILELFEKEYHRYLENVVIALPEDKIIIEKSEYDALKKRDTQGRYMSMNELLELLSVSRSLVHRKCSL